MLSRALQVVDAYIPTAKKNKAVKAGARCHGKEGRYPRCKLSSLSIHIPAIREQRVKQWDMVIGFPSKMAEVVTMRYSSLLGPDYL